MIVFMLKKLLFIILVISWSLSQPATVRSYFVGFHTSSQLVVQVGDWQVPNLSFHLIKSNQTSYQLKEEITDHNFEQMSQNLPVSSQPRWLGFRYRLDTDSSLCGIDFVPVQLFFDQELIWYMTLTPCQIPNHQWQTAVVKLPQSAGQLRFQLSILDDIDVTFKLESVTTLAVALTDQDRIEIKADEKLQRPPIDPSYTQDGYQVMEYQVTDLANQVSELYKLVSLRQSTPPALIQAPTIYQDSQGKVSLSLMPVSSDCFAVSFDQVVSLAPVIPWLEWSSANPLICGMTTATPLSLTMSLDGDQLKMTMTNMSGLQSEVILF